RRLPPCARRVRRGRVRRVPDARPQRLPRDASPDAQGVRGGPAHRGRAMSRSHRATAMFLATAAAAGAAAAALPAAATLPGANGRIAFARPGTGIWTVNRDGSGLTHVSPAPRRNASCDSDPFFSPHGSWLLFQGCNPERHVTNVGRMTAFGGKR